jgi:hypothetical protein
MLTLHILAVLFVLVVAFIADIEAMSWMRGKTPLLDHGRMRLYHGLTWWGYGVLVVTGIFLLLPMMSYALSQPLFVMKLLFVAVLFFNGLLIGKLSYIACERRFEELTTDEKWKLLTSGALSTFSWLAAIVLALVVFG